MELKLTPLLNTLPDKLPQLMHLVLCLDFLHAQVLLFGPEDTTFEEIVWHVENDWRLFYS